MPESKPQITTVDAERFKQTVFVRIVVSKPGVRSKVKSLTAIQEYLAQLAAEQSGQPNGHASLAVDGTVSEIARNPVGVTKRLFIPVPATKENGVQQINDPIEKANRFLDSVKSKLVGRFGVAQPSRIMDGLYVLPESRVSQFNEEIRAAKNRLVMDFLPEIESGYEEAREKARTAALREGGLGPLYDPRDYIGAEEFCAGFDISALWLKLEAPDNVSKELQAEFRAEFQARKTEAMENIFTALRVQFADLVAHMAEVLTPGEDGKPRIFKSGTVDNIKQFLAVFADRNIFNDTELEAVVEKARALMTGVDAEKIRKSADVRESTQAQFASLKADLDRLVTTAPGRKFTFDE